jgi:hypothetical protein
MAVVPCTCWIGTASGRSVGASPRLLMPIHIWREPMACPKKPRRCGQARLQLKPPRPQSHVFESLAPCGILGLRVHLTHCFPRIPTPSRLFNGHARRVIVCLTTGTCLLRIIILLEYLHKRAPSPWALEFSKPAAMKGSPVCVVCLPHRRLGPCRTTSWHVFNQQNKTILTTLGHTRYHEIF